MIFEVKCDELTYEELTDRTHTRIVSFIVLEDAAGAFTRRRIK